MVMRAVCNFNDWAVYAIFIHQFVAMAFVMCLASVIGSKASVIGSKASVIGSKASVIGSKASIIGSKASVIGSKALTCSNCSIVTVTFAKC